MKITQLMTSIGIAAVMAQPASAAFPNGVASGDTTSNSTVLWARSDVAGNVRFRVKDGNKSVSNQVVTVTNPMRPAKLVVRLLQAGKTYTYEVSGPNGAFAKGSFKTAPAKTARGVGLRFGVTGDWRGELAPYPAIKNVPASSLNFFIKLGDTIYADYPSPAFKGEQAKTVGEYRLKHNEVYGTRFGANHFANLQKNVSVFATIDDHEVMNDFAGGALAADFPDFLGTTGFINQTPLYNNGLQAFHEYNPIINRRYPIVGDNLTDERLDLYRSQRYGRTAAVYLLDARSFRDTGLDNVTDISSAAQIGGFIASSFDASTPAKTRTMLGKAQMARLKADLLAAHTEKVVWKFIAIPEPIQNLGVLLASDRFEGYASERTELLQFIDENKINNVVFISADIHGTIINDLTYQRRNEVLSALATSGNPLAAPQIKTSAFEITTGSVAFSPPFGDAVVGLLGGVPNGNLLLQALYNAAGVSNLKAFNALSPAAKSTALGKLLDDQLSQLAYTPIGLQDNNLIDAKLTRGGNVALFSFGWTRFDIAPTSQELKITTYGITPYTQKEMASNSNGIKGRQPQVVSELVVKPKK